MNQQRERLAAALLLGRAEKVDVLIRLCKAARLLGDDAGALRALGLATGFSDGCPQTDCRLLSQLGALRRTQNRPQSACSAFGLASCIASLSGNRTQWARAESEFGLCLVELEHYSQAKGVLELALVGLGRCAGQSRYRAGAHLGLATVAGHYRRDGAAEHHYSRAAAETNRPDDKGKILANLGRTQLQRGKVEEALRSLRTALPLISRPGDRAAILTLMEQAAPAATDEGELRN